MQRMSQNKTFHQGLCRPVQWAARAILAALLFQGCATYKPQVKKSVPTAGPAAASPEYTFFLAGGWGHTDPEKPAESLTRLESELAAAGTNSELLLLGDMISEEPGNRERDSALLGEQLDLLRRFQGRTTVIPGNNEWKEFSARKRKWVEDYMEERDTALKMQLVGECPIEYRDINDRLAIILVDSKWFISNWSRVEHINEACVVMDTRKRFAEELDGYINDAQGKNLIIAMHHPLFSNGKYAGKETLGSHMRPAPVIGTMIHATADLGAFSPDRLISRRYNYLRILVSALAQKSDRAVVVSAHEESLQYLRSESIHQIISGSLGRATATHRSKETLATVGGSLEYEGIYTNGSRGFSRLDTYPDGSVSVRFFPEGGQEVSYELLPALPEPESGGPYEMPAEAEVASRVLDDPEQYRKNGFYTFLWGDRYREYFGEKVTAPVASLDTLYGGLKVTQKGGGHQSYSIRLEDAQGRQYAMRSLRKDALKFLAFKVPGVAYVPDDYKETLAHEVVSDFFTTAHPYMQLVISPLARSIGVNHSSPSLYYIPKQEALGELNAEFGDELYFIEERPSDEQLNYKGYRRTIDEKGEIKDFESTTDMLELLRSDESYTLDQRAYVRARLFDMLIGDWDRHQDQWRWVEYEKPDGSVEFMPVPRDRDNAFPKFDGTALPVIQWFAPGSRRFQSFGPEYGNLKWLNTSGGRLDKVLLPDMRQEDWVAEARYIQEHLGDAEIDAAFERLPQEVQDSTAASIRNDLKVRLKNLHQAALAYGESLDRRVILRGTEKDDIIEIERLPEGNTRVVIRRNLTDEPNTVMLDRTLEAAETRELWIYGLGDDDIFRVTGPGTGRTFIRLIGGYGEDRFEIGNDSRLKVYDWQYEKTEFSNREPRHQYTNIYSTNTYHWRYYEPSFNKLVPFLGFRVDDGLAIGATDTYTYKGFNGEDFRQQHRFGAKYFFNFGALEASYSGVYANALPGWNFETEAYYASNRFVRNFFGIGNETVNLEDDLDIDYYRARVQSARASAGLAYHTLKIRAVYETHKAQELEDRFFTPENLDPDVFTRQHYAGAETELSYHADDVDDFPTKAIYIGLSAGYQWNLRDAERHFGYLQSRLSLSHKVIPSGDLVLGTTAEVRTNFGGDYFFYQAPALGGDNGLRGYRDQRFTGRTYFYQSTDLRWRIKRYVTLVAPVTVGLYGGFDYGRVWNPGESSGVWHTSRGGGFWISGFNYLAFNIGYFNSREGNFFQVGFGFGF
ncbi:hypothetical protein [Robiginitalea biformata]|uniref:hypothetical protein n=1 Tax=Robiginitalea biformata TaxID=252307 RepID=UPI003B5937C6